MTRRIVRTMIQLAAAAVFTAVVVLFLDRNYRVLPTSIHGYMPSHHPGLVVTDVTIAKCSSVNLFSSCDLDPSKWTRVPKELYLGKTWTSSAYMFVRRKREEDLTADDSVVMDVSVGRMDPGTETDSDEQWEPRPSGLWIKRSTNKKSSDSDNVITDIDVLFGDDAVEAREGWTMQGTPLLLNAGSSVLNVHVTVRRGAHHQPKKPKPRIQGNGRFKIMQIADLHLSTGVGTCRDAVPPGYNGGECEADPRTLDFVIKMLDDEKPDLVVLSGDQVNGGSAPDAATAMFKIVSLLIERKIPYAAIFGNHDDESTMSREAQMALMETLPYSLSMPGPEDIDGVGNYYVEVLARGNSDHSALTIYLLDSHSYSPDERNFPGYDWIKPNQISWFKQTASGLKSKHREYTHRHMDIAFTHIPLSEYMDWDLPRLGTWREGVTAPLFNTGFRDALIQEGVVMVSAGHDHCNDYCSLSLLGSKDPTKNLEKYTNLVTNNKRKQEEEEEKPPTPEDLTPALWMCYAGGVGFGGYAGYYDYVRRLRLFEIDTNEARITTWKRLEYGDTESRIEEQIIVDGGKPVPPPPPPPQDPQQQPQEPDQPVPPPW